MYPGRGPLEFVHFLRRKLAELARRLLQRGATALSERGERAVTASRIAIGAAHRDQVAAIRAELSFPPG